MKTIQNGPSRFVLPDWNADLLRVEGSFLEVIGWILPSHIDAKFEVLINQRRAQLMLTPARPDVIQAWAPIAEHSQPLGFSARLQCVEQEVVSVELLEDGAPSPVGPWYFPMRETSPVPDAKRRERVCGAGVEQNFLRNGYSHFRKISELTKRYGPAAPTLRILDWGCGAGAVARYGVLNPDWEYHGADIDHDNIGWCQGNLPQRASFQVISTQPPTPFADRFFDVVFGISVLTHLREKDQLLWLAELARIIRPEGACFLSVLGGQAAAKVKALSGPGSNLIRGILFGEGEHEIGRIVGDPLYYGTTFHSENYIRSTWSRWFNVVDYLTAFLGHQDMVILRPRLK